MPNILEWSQAILASTPVRWFNLVQTVPLDLLTMRPAPNEWSALDCLQHLVDVERVSTPVRLKALLAGEAFPAFNPADHAPKAPRPTCRIWHGLNERISASYRRP